VRRLSLQPIIISFRYTFQSMLILSSSMDHVSRKIFSTDVLTLATSLRVPMIRILWFAYNEFFLTLTHRCFKTNKQHIRKGSSLGIYFLWSLISIALHHHLLDFEIRFRNDDIVDIYKKYVESHVMQKDHRACTVS
jgi:hypothetical protein